MICNRGHSYDIAREGYVNLLLANQKASLAPGDTRRMARSRREFLRSGYFAPLSEGINAAVAARLCLGDSIHTAVLDAGCGEGYYVHALMEALQGQAQAYGIDISKDAVKLGAAAYKDIQFAVASIHQLLPFAAASLSCILNVFAPRHPAEFARILRPDGCAVVVVPAMGHLAELHSILGIALIEDGKDQRAVSDFADVMLPVQQSTLRYSRTVSPDNVRHLIQMTPTFWHLSDDAHAKLTALPALDIGFAFTIIILQPIA